MLCNKCGKEIPNDSDFCTYCGANLKDKRHEVSNTKKIKIKNVIKSHKVLIAVGIILLLIIIATISAIFIDFEINNNNESRTNENNSTSQVAIEGKEIPEERKVTVRFIEAGKEDSVETKEIDRELILNYLSELHSSIYNSGLINEWVIYEYKIALYYIEYDCKIGNLDKYRTNKFGAIEYCNLTKSGYSTKNYFKTFIANWTRENQALNAYSVIYESDSLNSPPNNIANIRNNRILEDLKNTVESSNVEISNIRIGFINVEENNWLKEYFSKQQDELAENEKNPYEQYDIEYEKITNEDYAITEDAEIRNNYQDYTNKNQKELSVTIMNSEKTTQSTYMSYLDVKPSISGEYNITVKNNEEIIKSANNVYLADYSSKNICTVYLSEGSNTIEVSISNANGQTATATYTIIATFSAPTIKIINTETNTSSGEIDLLNYEITNPDDTYNWYYDITIKNNDTVVKTYTNKRVDPYSSLDELYFPLSEGINKIEIIATNEKGKTATATYTITRN